MSLLQQMSNEFEWASKPAFTSSIRSEDLHLTFTGSDILVLTLKRSAKFATKSTKMGTLFSGVEKNYHAISFVCQKKIQFF